MRAWNRRGVSILCLFVSGEFVDGMGFSHFAVGGLRGTLGHFDLFSSSCHPSSRSSFLSLMLPLFNSSESVKSRETSATSLSGVFTLAVVSLASGRISGSNVAF